MLCYGSGDTIEKYKDYRNRTMQKHMDKINKQLWAIKECSLKAEDKEKLRLQMTKAAESFKF